MIASFLSTRLGVALGGCALLMMTACAEKEVVLIGQREDIRPSLAGTPLERAPDADNNQSRPIQLPAQVGNATWAQSPGTAANRVANARLGAATQRLWKVNIGAGDGRRGRITADPVVAGGLIYTLDSSAQVSAVTPAGQLAWQTDLTPATDSKDQATGGGMAYDNGVLYVSTGFGRLSAIDARTGQVRWTQKLDATGSGTPLVSGGFVYLVAGDDTGWAIKASDGTIAWRADVAPSIANVLGAPAPVLANKFVVFAFGSGEILGVFRQGGLVRWQAMVAGQRTGRVSSRISDVTGSPVVVGNTIYAGNHSGRIAALDAGDGTMIWSARQGTMGPVWPAGDSIFAVSDNNQLLRLSASTGENIWAHDLPDFVKAKPRKRAAIFAHYGPVLAGGRLVVASNDGFLRFFSPQDGRLLSSVEIPDGATTGPVVANGTLYVVSTAGDLYAFR